MESEREGQLSKCTKSVVILSLFHLHDSGSVKSVPVILLCSVCEASLGFKCPMVISLWTETQRSSTGRSRCLIKDLTVLANANTQHRGALRQL